MGVERSGVGRLLLGRTDPAEPFNEMSVIFVASVPSRVSPFDVLCQRVSVLRLHISEEITHKCADRVPAPAEPRQNAVRGNVSFCSTVANPVIRLELHVCLRHFTSEYVK